MIARKTFFRRPKTPNSKKFTDDFRISSSCLSFVNRNKRKRKIKVDLPPKTSMEIHEQENQLDDSIPLLIQFLHLGIDGTLRLASQQGFSLERTEVKKMELNTKKIAGKGKLMLKMSLRESNSQRQKFFLTRPRLLRVVFLMLKCLNSIMN